MIKYVRHIFMILVGITITLPIFSYDFEVNGLCYNKISDDQLEVTYKNFDGNSYSGSLSIPSSVTYNAFTYTVTSIGSRAFYNCSKLTGSLTIPESVTSIGNYAFFGCYGLSGSLNIPSSVKAIDQYAFYGCNGFSGSLKIPSSVTSIGSNAFDGCSGFTGSLTIPNSVTTIGAYAFSRCSGFTGSLTIPNSVKSIGHFAFAQCSGFNGSLKISNSVNIIGNNAFDGCSGFTGSLTIPNSLTSIASRAFAQCSGFTGSLTIPSSVKLIYDSAFEGCSGFDGSLTVPSSITYIGNSVFKFCRQLSMVESWIESPFNIAEDVFLGIPSNAVLQVPKGTKSKYEAYTGWTKNFSKIEERESGNQDEVLNGIEINGLYYNLNVKDKTATVTSKTNGEDYSGSLSIPSSVTYNGSTYTVTAIGPLAFFSDAGLTGSLTIPNSVTSIGESAFQWCRGFTGSLTIPNSVTSIGKNAFAQCSGFTGSLTIPNSVTSIGSNAFEGCSGFTGSLIIPNSLSSIESYAFIGCSGFTGSLIIPNSVTSIGHYAFHRCSGFNGSLTIPGSVTFIGNGAFKDCNLLSVVESWIESPFDITEDVFQNIASIATLQVPNGTKSKYESYTEWTKNFSKIEEKESESQDEILNGIEINGLYYNLNVKDKTATVTYKNYEGNSYSGSLSIPSSVNYNGSTYTVTAIGSRAFYNCYSLTGSLSIPGSITYIGKGAFYCCYGLSGLLNIPNSVKIIDESAFANCNGFTGSLIIPNSVLSIGGNAFYNCTGFTGSLTIHNSVNTIGHAAFWGCSGFTGPLTIPSSVTNIGSRAFYNCSGFTGPLTIPSSVTSVGYAAFANCIGFNGSLTIPNSVTYIEGSAFKNCKNISMVESWIEAPFYIMEDVFQDIASNATLQVPMGTKSKYEAYTGWIKYFSKIIEAESPTTTYELSITAFGNGSVSYDGTTIRSNTSTFTVNEGTSATITFNPDNGYKIKSVKVNSSDVTSNLSNNKYTISNINKNTTVEVEFQEETKAFSSNGINYTIISYDNKTVNLANGNYGIVLEVPATLTYQGVTWSVTGIDNNALANSNDLAAIIWDPSVAFTGSVSNPNLLLYVKSASYAPATIKNVVVNSIAESIILTDAASGNNFYCPQEFTARKISYTHNYGMITGIGECRGWETIALPFDVKKIAHSSKGELTPFANWRSGDSRKPFWLMSYGAGGWSNASSINANTPYIISMPNNQDYKAEFKLSGNITFSSENVTVKKSDNLQTGSYNGNSFIPNFIITNNSGYLLLNVNNDYVSYTGDSAEGSTFIANLRTVHPFEAYMTSTSKTRSTISINGDMATGIEDISVLMDESKGLRIYNLKGQLIKVEQNKDIDDVKSSLPAGVYIVNGKKLIIK